MWISRRSCTVRTPPCRSLYAPPCAPCRLSVHCRRPPPHRLQCSHAAHTPSTCAAHLPRARGSALSGERHAPQTQERRLGAPSLSPTVQHAPGSRWAAAEARLPRQVHRAARVPHQPHPPLTAALVQSSRSVVHLHLGARRQAVGQRVTVAAPLSRRGVRFPGSTADLAHRSSGCFIGQSSNGTSAVVLKRGGE